MPSITEKEMLAYQNIQLPEIIYDDFLPKPISSTESIKELKGVPTSKGFYIGPVKVVKGVKDMEKRVLISGITGQDGSYLADFLLQKGYKVFGMVRRSSMEKFDRIEHIKDKIEIRQADLLDQYSLIQLIEDIQPQEVYNLAAMSFVPTSWTQPVLTAEFTAIGVTRMLEAIRAVNPKVKFYQASSSEMFGLVKSIPQNEET